MAKRQEPKPIPTHYQGCRFRSRLEARWAVFFDHLGIGWEYEPEGWVLGGVPYLPDFKLVITGETVVLAEVKAAEIDPFEGVHIDLCRQVAKAAEMPVVLLQGTPAFRAYNQFTPNLADDALSAVFFRDWDPKLVVADRYWFQQLEVDKFTGALAFPHDDLAASRSFGQGLVGAVEAARSARFEHGEKPRRP